MSRRLRPTEWLFGAAALVFAVASAILIDDRAVVFEPAPRDAETVRIVTWNIGSGGDGPRPARDEHLPAVAAALRTLDADLAFLQEIADRDQATRLAKLLGDGWSVRTRRGGGVAFAYRRGQLRRLRDGSPWPRRQALAAVFRPERGPAITVVNLHADYLSSKKRNQLIGRAADFAHGRPPAILAGDFNLDVDFRKRGDLFTDNLHRDIETYNYVAGKLRDAALRGGSTAEPDRRLDYLFASPDRFTVMRSGPWKGKRVGDMDHDPVVADLRF